MAVPNSTDITVQNGGCLTLINIVIIIFDSVLLLVLCTENILTIITLWRTPQLRIVPNLYVASLAVADFLAGATMSYQMIIEFPWIKSLLDTNFLLCICRHVIFFVTLSASLLSLMAVAVDRVIYIQYPLHYQRLMTPTKAGVAIAMVWTIGIVAAIPPLYDNHWGPGTPCISYKVLTMRYQVLGQGLPFLSVSFVIMVCYGQIVKIAYRQRKTVRNLSNAIRSSDGTFISNKDFKLVKMFMLVFGVFFACWFPAFVCIIMSYTCGIPEAVYTFVVPLIMLNSGMNFVIYVLKNKDFKKSVKEIVCCHRTG